MSVVSVRLLLALTILAGLSVALVWVLPEEALARPVFQSPLTDQPPTITPTLTIAGAGSDTPAPTNNPGHATPRPPAEAPLAAPLASEGKAPGFLPPPTLSAPGGPLPPLLPGPGQPLAAPPAPTPRPTPIPAANANEALSLARLIDAAIIALSYIWLCCGILVLISVTLGLVWLAWGKGRG